MGFYEFTGIFAGGYIFVIGVALFLAFKGDFLKGFTGCFIITLFIFSTIFCTLSLYGKTADYIGITKEMKKEIKISKELQKKQIKALEDLKNNFLLYSEESKKRHINHVHYYNGKPK